MPNLIHGSILRKAVKIAKFGAIAILIALVVFLMGGAETAWKYLFAHPAVMGIVLLVISIALGVSLAYFSSFRVYVTFARKSSRRTSGTLAFVWYFILSVVFSVLVSVLLSLVLSSLGVREYDLSRFDYYASPYMIPLFAVSVLAGAALLVYRMRRQIINRSDISWMRTLWPAAWPSFAIFLVLFIVLIAFRIPQLNEQERTKEVVAKIHANKLTMDDVMGKNLPPDPGPEADKTIQGIDANNNGIRDDVELAIFKEYPNSAKTRAVLLQYALALQMEMMQPIVNRETVIAAIQEEDRSYICIGDIVPREASQKFDEATDLLTKFVKARQLNTQERKKYRTYFYEKIGSYNSLARACDIDYSKLPN